MSGPTLEITLDVRDLRKRRPTAEEILRTWNDCAVQIYGRTLRMGDCGKLMTPEREVIAYTVIGVAEPAVVTAETAIAIHSLIEPPAADTQCCLCAATGQVRSGFFQCQQCKPATRICFDHVRLLGNAVRGGRVVATCELHVPQCTCGKPATFWCLGPACRGRSAWCVSHSRQHPNSRETYCFECYERVYPSCTVTNCAEVAHNTCEHVNAAQGEACGGKVCSLHVTRWQVFGYEKIGLARCQLHRAIRSLSDAEVAWQLVAGTAVRHERGDEHRYNLPSLPSLKNILLKARRQQYSAQSVLVFFQQVEAQLRAIHQRSKLHDRMLRLIGREKPRWTEQAQRERDEFSTGAEVLQRLKQELLSMGLTELASAVQMTDYRPRFIKGPPPRPALFVKIPDHLRSRFIGRQGTTIKVLAQHLGVELKLEELK
jgi:hypothetical protein